MKFLYAGFTFHILVLDAKDDPFIFEILSYSEKLYDVVILAIMSCIIISSFATRTKVTITKAFFKLRLLEMVANNAIKPI